ncbi:MAG TPA: phosphoribosylaminoimidazolesuccinocarboxamide synthase [Planctomycetes bacterium]|nr:phosphoribosylaminoimidazolesuccinocarboxamide synthase [Planctomycetota bacterium]
MTLSLPPTVLETDLSSARLLGKGKVRDLYELGGDLLLVATDRLSAFDVVLPTGIPGRGRILCSLSAFWFRMTRDLCDNHMISTEVSEWQELSPRERELLEGRTMRCRKAEPLPVEWVVRGYLTGSGWKDYKASGAVSGVQLEKGLQHAQALPEPILTASTKAEEGHDEPISFEQVCELVGEELAHKGRELALALYKRGHDYAKEKGFILADTKFELGLLDNRLLLIDECLTPDSSRYWPRDQVRPGAFPESYDKQVVRDYLETLDWDKTAPGPALPPEIQEKALDRYLEIHQALTGLKLF